jgi:hypothetical protein
MADENVFDTVLPDTPKNDDEQASTASPEEIAEKLSDNQNLTSILHELMRSQQLASVYIDARSGGVFFGDQTEIHGGEFVGGNQSKLHQSNFRSQTNEFVVGRVLSDDIEKITHVYVKTIQYDDMYKQFNDHNICIVVGQFQTGKWTSVVHTYSSWHESSGSPIYELNPVIDISSLVSFQFAAKSFYIIDNVSADTAGKLDLATLNRIENRLKKENSFLALIADQKTMFNEISSEKYFLEWRATPDKQATLEKHIRWYSLSANLPPGNNPFDLVDDSQIQEVFRNLTTPRDIDRLAELLVKAALGRLKLEDVVFRFSLFAHQQIEKWFHNHTELDTRTFLIALATLNGASYNSVLAAQKRLLARFVMSMGCQNESSKSDAFGLGRKQKLNDCFAHLAEGFHDREFGRERIEVVELDNPIHQPVVLNYVWQEFDMIRDILLEWLFELGSIADSEIRLRASLAVGEISKSDFGRISSSVIAGWAKHSDPRVRLCAANALGVPGWSPNHAPQVLGLLHHWSTLQGNWRLQWVAAAAYGGLVGLRFPSVAMKELREIARSSDPRLFQMIHQSISNLFQGGTVSIEYYLVVLEELESWLEDTEIVRITGLMIFLGIFRNSAIKDESNKLLWSTVLWIGSRYDSEIQRIANFMQRALNEKTTRKIGLEVLEHTILQLSDMPYQEGVFNRVLLHIWNGGTSRDRDRLTFYLAKWSATSSAADRIVTYLNKTIEQRVYSESERYNGTDIQPNN